MRGTQTTPVLPTSAEIFAANRASGGVTLAAGFVAGRTRPTHVSEHGSLRVRFPNRASDMMEAVLINTAGGMTGGDEFSIKLLLGAGATLLVGTAAAEKIYRSTGSDTAVGLTIDAVGGSRCLWLPQETILFDGAHLARRIEVDLADDAALLMAEAIIYGRSAMGEVVNEGRLIDCWRVRRGGRLIFAESVRFDGAVSGMLAQLAVAAGAVAIATVLMVPGDEQKVAAVRALGEQFIGEVGISAWNGIAVARLCAGDGSALRHDLTALLGALAMPLPRLWPQ